MIEKVVFATDLSAPSREVLNYAARFCKRTGARLIGTYAFEAPRALESNEGLRPDELEDLKSRYRSRLEAFFKSPKLADVDVKVKMAFGIPQEAISELLLEEDADLSIVGKHGRSTLERFFLGSNTEKILRLAQRPVLVVPPGRDHRVDWDLLCCAVDFSKTSKEALSLAVRFVREYETGLKIVHEVEMGASFDESREDLDEKLEGALKRRRERIKDLLRRSDAPDSTEVEVEFGKATESILAAARESGSDLLIMGIRGESEYAGLGAVSSAVLRAANIPVLLVPGR